MKSEAEKGKVEFRHCPSLVLARYIDVMEPAEMDLNLIQIKKENVQEQFQSFLMKSQAQWLKPINSLFRSLRKEYWCQASLVCIVS